GGECGGGFVQDLTPGVGGEGAPGGAPEAHHLVEYAGAFYCEGNGGRSGGGERVGGHLLIIGRWAGLSEGTGRDPYLRADVATDPKAGREACVTAGPSGPGRILRLGRPGLCRVRTPTLSGGALSGAPTGGSVDGLPAWLSVGRPLWRMPLRARSRCATPGS